MLILLDNNAPRGLARALTGHIVTEARERGWATLKNGAFEGRKIAIVVLTQLRWRLVRRMLTEIAAAVNAATPGSFVEVEIPRE